MDVAEVAIRIGETTVDHVYVARGERFWIGSLPGAQLAVAGVGLFPLVTGASDGFSIRVPVGTALAVDGRTSSAAELRLEGDRVVTARFGLAALEIRLVQLPRIAIPRPPPDARPAAYTAVSLLAHLAVWAAAIVLVPEVASGGGRHHLMSIGSHRRFEPAAGAQAPQVLARVDFTGPPEAGHAVTEAIAPSTARAANASRASSHPHKAPDTPDPSETHDAGAAITRAVTAAVGDVVRTFDAVNVEGALAQVGPVYRPDESPGFGSVGTGRLFDPTHRADFQSIAAGRYVTTATGPHAGQGYDLDRVALCAPPGCATSGPLREAQLRDALEAQRDGIQHCYGARHGTVVLALSIDEHGAVSHISAVGPDEVADCAAQLVAAVQFPAAASATQAKVPLVF